MAWFHRITDTVFHPSACCFHPLWAAAAAVIVVGVVVAVWSCFVAWLCCAASHSEGNFCVVRPDDAGHCAVDRMSKSKSLLTVYVGCFSVTVFHDLCYCC